MVLYFKNNFSCTFALCLLAVFLSTEYLMAREYEIIPYPQELIVKKGTFVFNKQTVILSPFDKPEICKLAEQFSEQMALVSGIKMKVCNLVEKKDSLNVVIFENNCVSNENVEAYSLQISPKFIRIQAQAPNGFFYAIQTIYQLFPPEIYGKQRAIIKKWRLPALKIADAPRFIYRGLHLDVGRHFYPVEFIKKYIDAMAIHKLNTFHWHLTEDQGWRIEIKKYPLLTQIGSRRDETLVGPNFYEFPKKYDGKSHSGFYTQDQAKEIVEYAKERFVTVIPEIELPGHAQAALAAYPFLSCTNDSTLKVATTWGVFKDIYCPRESTFTFLEDVLIEIMNIFPGKYIHIGGDESPRDRWIACPDCQALIKKLNLKDEHELQSYFVQGIEKFVNAHGRQIIGWDEILDGGLAPNATVMSWRGSEGGVAAAKAAHNVIMTPQSHCYFDKYQADPATEPLAICCFIPLNKVYDYEPIPNELTSDEAKYVLGAQACVWSEYLPTPESVEYMVFPRISAMAEVLWENKDNKNWNRFRNSMTTQFSRFEQLNINASKAFFDVQFQSSLNSDKTIEVKLNTDCPEAQIRFTTNGNVPTLKDHLYIKSLTLNEPTTIRAAVFVKNKMVGKPLTKLFIVSKLTGYKYSKNTHNSSFNDQGESALTDGKVGSTKVKNDWIAFQRGTDAEIVIDLQSVKQISRFSVGLLNTPTMCAKFPLEINLLGSDDGVNFNLLSSQFLNKEDSEDWKMIRPEMNFSKASVHFLKLTLNNAGLCADDKGSLLFLDEIAAW